MAKIKGAQWEAPIREEYKLLSFQEVMALNGFEMQNEAPPPADIGDVKGAEPAISVTDGQVEIQPDLQGNIYGAEFDENICRDLKIVSYDGLCGGISVEGAGSNYTVEDAVIHLSGDGAGVGGKSAGASVANHGTLTLNRVNISMSGTSRTATSAYGNAVLRVNNSTLISHGSPYGADVPCEVTTVTPPRILEIEGNCRTHCTSGNSASYFKNSTILTDGWAALSTDMSAGYVYLEAENCRVVATKSGYGVYADYFCHDLIRNCDFDVACMAAILGGNADVTFRDSRLKCGSYLALMHCVMGSYKEVGKLVVENCDVTTEQAVVKVKSQNVIVRLKNSNIVSSSGVLLETTVNDDPVATRVLGRKVYGDHVYLTDMDITGDVIHNDPERDAYVYLQSSVLRGAVKHAMMVLDPGSKWIATGDSDVILGSDVDTAQIDAAEGITIHAKCGDTGSYTLASGGKLIME